MNDSYITVLNGRVKLRQIEGGLKTSTDSVMLAASCPVSSGQSVLDLGCGVGSAGLCLLARVSYIHLTGVDIQDDHVECAHGNAVLNGFEATSDFLVSDIKIFQDNRYDHVICNPPYESSGAYLRSPSEKKDQALGHKDGACIEDWIKCAYNNLKSGGMLTLIHKADRLHDIVRSMGKAWGDLEVIPLFQKLGQPAKRMIIRARKQRKGLSKLHFGLVVHEKGGEYTTQAQSILREAHGLYTD